MFSPIFLDKQGIQALSWPLSPPHMTSNLEGLVCILLMLTPEPRCPLRLEGAPLLSFKNTSWLLVSGPKEAPCLGLWFGSQLQTRGALWPEKEFECGQTRPSPTGTALPSSYQHANWPAPDILLLKSTHFTASFPGASNLGRAGLGQAPVSTTTWTLSGYHPAVVDSLPSTSKKSPPRRHVLTSTFRATGSKFLEDFQHILSLISPSGLQKCCELVLQQLITCSTSLII